MVSCQGLANLANGVAYTSSCRLADANSCNQS